MTTGSSAKRPAVVLEPPPPKPVLTVLLICMMPLFLADGKIDWIERTAMIPVNLTKALAGHDYTTVAQSMFSAAFAEMSAWQWLLNGLFLWIFGSAVERKLKGWRYPLFVSMMIFTGWISVLVTAGGTSESLYIGPAMMLCGLLGGYFAFFPKKPFTPQEWVKDPGKIFNREVPDPAHKRFVNPWIYVTSFAVYVVVVQVCLMFGKDWVVDHTHIKELGDAYQAIFGRIQTNPQAVQPIGAFVNIAFGSMIAGVLPQMAHSVKTRRPGGKTQLQVVQHYRELRTLDLTHDQACEGAAKFAAVPLDVAKDWISKGAAGLRDQEIH